MRNAKNNTNDKEIKFSIKRVILITLYIAILLGFSLIIGFASVNGNSMHPTLKDNDLLLINKSKSVCKGDIICIESDALNMILIKRVIGTEGDRIQITENGLYVNDILLEEDYLNENDWLKEEIDLIVPEGHVFVMGDNRNFSTDSREIGTLPLEEVKGIYIANITRATGLHRAGFYTAMLCILSIIYIGTESLKKTKQ